MDSVLFEEWMRNVSKKFQPKGRKVTLIIDNYPAYPITRVLHVKLVFFATKYYISQSVDEWSRNKMSQGPLQETISKTDTAQSRL